jgi:hypothetical protein
MIEEDKEIQMPKPEEPAVEQEAQITLADISTCKTIIEIASAKGAFEAKELAVVGLTYNRIVQWLLANQPKVTEAEETSKAEGETKDD